MPTRGSYGGDNIDCVIHEVGEVTCDKGFRFAFSGVCQYQVVRGTPIACINPPAPNQYLVYRPCIMGLHK